MSPSIPLLTLVCLLLGLWQTVGAIKNKTKNYEALEVIGKSPGQLLELRGFQYENYYAPTSDGYLINTIRIVNPALNGRKPPKRPVIFNHGLFESATIWLINSLGVQPLDLSEECGPLGTIDDQNGTLYVNGPMMLANYGYDVFLMSMRGTDWSMKHKRLSPQDDKFWDYCLDDFGLRDVPAVVKYVRRLTGAEKIGYVGHSQATFSVFALLSERPYYAKILEPVVAVAPVAYFDHITSLGRPLFMGTLATTKDFEINGRFPPDGPLIRATITGLCSLTKKEHREKVCEFIEMLVSGQGKRWLKGFYSHLPFYTSLKVLRQFGWLIKNKRFSKYDYGPDKNYHAYGKKTSPSYPIAKISSRSLVLISTKSDALSHPIDVARFKAQLTVPLLRDIYINRNFDHFDLITDPEARRLVFEPMLEVFEELAHRDGNCATPYEE